MEDLDQTYGEEVRATSRFVLGARSQQELSGVHPLLIEVVERAITLTPVDFTVFDGLRTEEEQAEYIRSGASHVVNSKHLTQPDGFGHAVDLVPWIARKARWELAACCKIAETIRAVVKERAIIVRWGGSWDILNETTEPTAFLVQRYSARRYRNGRRPFIDAVHYELVL